MKRPIPPWRRLPRGVRWALVVLVAAVTLPACGKKGPPLPPLVKLPMRVDQFVARRFGLTVYIQVHIPNANADGTTPADLQRVDIYGFTGSPSGNEDILKRGTVVASIPVRKPPKEDENRQSSGSRKGKRGTPPPEDTTKTKKPPPPPRPPASMENGFDQGDTVVVTEPLGPAQLKPLPPSDAEKKAKPKPEPIQVVAPPLGPPPGIIVPTRVYVAVPVNHKRQKGGASGRQVVPLVDGASAPAAPTLTYDETGVTIAWTAPPDFRPGVQAPPTEDVLKSRPFGMVTISGGFNVYEAPPPAPAPRVGGAPFPALPVAVGGKIPVPLNDKLLASGPFVDKHIEFGTPHCYVVRTVTQFGLLSTESDASPPACVSAVDTFAPAPPKGLQAVGGEGVVGLVWEANTESDLAGYLVLRANPADLQWVILTPTPITETSYRDTSAERGVRYAYVVVAVDKANNRSKPSNQVEESAR